MKTMTRLGSLFAVSTFQAPLAFATNYDVEICITIAPNFEDLEGGDIWDENWGGTVFARGIWLVIESWDDGVFLATLKNGYVDDNTGCYTQQVMSSTLDYAIKVKSRALVNGVYVGVYDDETTPTERTLVFYAGTIANHFTPTSAAPLNLVVPDSNWSRELAVGTYAMNKNNAGLGEELKYVDTLCCNGGYQRYIRAATDHKFVLGHETGHGVLRIRDGNNTPQENQGAGEDNCNGDDIVTSHSTTSKEWYSTALKEGIADFYSAWIFNVHVGQSDCEYDRHYGTDFDLDGDFETADGLADCEAVPASGLASYVSGDDWLEDLINAADPAACSGGMTHKSTQFDILRYGWDMLTDQAVPFSEIVDIWDDANPRDWNDTHNILTPANDPENRWSDAADANGFLAEHLAEDHNGLDH